MLEKNYKIRIVVVFIIFCFLYLLLIGRIFFIQVYKKDFFIALGQAQYNVQIDLSPPRAQIYDCNNVSLAVNKEVFSAFLLPHQLINQEKTITFLQKYYPQIFERITKNSQRYFFWLERSLSNEKLAWLKEQNCEDINFIAESRRFYPYVDMASILGMTNVDNQGIAGLELAFEKQLSGKKSCYNIKKDARHRRFYFEKTVNKEGVAGVPLSITIDKALQFLAHEELNRSIDYFEAKKGSVIVLDPYTGAIEVMVNYPTFDPNAQIPVNLAATKNIAVTETYELGSVMKIFTTLAALEEGVVDYDELLDSEGKITYVDGFKVENWRSMGVMPFYESVKVSSNVALAKVAMRLKKKLYNHLTSLGFGRKTGIDFPGERSGFINLPKKWSKSSVLVMSFGYEFTASLLQLACAGAIIANGGYTIIPHFTKSDKIDFSKKKPLYSDKTLTQINQILELIGKRYPVKGAIFKGKTGTARMVIDGKYSTKKHHYTFFGIVERGTYKRVIVTFIEEPKKANLWAADVAAPLAQRIAEKIVLHAEQQ